MPMCIDLKAEFGKRFKIGHDPAYAGEYGENGRTADPWLVLLECRNGHIYPHGGEYLAAATNGRGSAARALASLPCVEVLQDGADGINGKFHIRDFAAVAKVMKPRRRRAQSPEQRAASLERLAAFRFQNGGDARRARMKGQSGIPTPNVA